MRVFIRSPLDTLHTPIVLSLDPDAKYSPSAENTTLQIQEECPVRIFIRSPLDTLHTPIVLSADPDTKYSPSAENTTLETEEECPVSLNREHIDKLSILDIYSPSFFLGILFITGK